MKVEIQAGRYVVAVSGGVDSVALLHALQGRQVLDLVVAHFDHGIREDSAEDRKFVQRLAERYQLPFAYEEGMLGAGASEAAARKARYDFLHRTLQAHQADAILTAHHLDDKLETALLNVMRGTGRKGLTSLQSTDMIKRPLLHIPKDQLITYAQANGLVWREDSTNQDERYTRNFLRRRMEHLSAAQKTALAQRLERMQHVNKAADELLTEALYNQPAADELERRMFSLLPHDVALELLAAWLRQNNIRQFDTKGLQRMAVAAKTLAPGQQIDVNATYSIEVGKHNLALRRRDR